MEVDEAPLSDGERHAIRAYLARAEVRMSTLHRVATAFIGGAGLMLLIPIFLRDVVDGILAVLLAAVGNPVFEQSTWGWILTTVLYVSIAYPFLLSLWIPFYALYLMLKDIVHFYFSIYTPGFKESLLNPTFSLGGLMLSPDEAPQAKKRAMRYQYSDHNSAFTIPFSKSRREEYFDKLVETTHGEIIPQSRRNLEGILPPDADPKQVAELNTAFGITRSLDRQLVEEVAVTEMLLSRNVLYLRRLFLRYIKTLLMFIWTTLISFVALPFLQDKRFPVWLVLSVAYLIWSLAVMRIIHLPIQWIYRHRYGDVNGDHIDVQLVLLENGVKPFCQIALGLSLISVILAILAVVQ
jgi:hypothetical protein